MKEVLRIDSMPPSSSSANSSSEIPPLPEEGEIVIATVKDIRGHGAYVSLDEYGGITSFLSIREIATGYVRNIQRFVRPKQKVVLKVIKVNKSRGEVDTSLKQITGEERKSKVIESKRSEKAAGFLDSIKAKAHLSDVQVKEIQDKILDNYDDDYEFFEVVATKGIGDANKKLGFSDEVVKAIEEESTKVRIAQNEIGGVMELSSKKPDGIEVIKGILVDAEKDGKRESSAVSIAYIGAPRYRIRVKAANFKTAEKALSRSLEKIQKELEGSQGNFSFTREGSSKKVF